MAPVVVIVYKRRSTGIGRPIVSNSLITTNIRYDWVFRSIKRNDQPIPCTDLLYMYKVK